MGGRKQWKAPIYAAAEPAPTSLFATVPTEKSGLKSKNDVVGILNWQDNRPDTAALTTKGLSRLTGETLWCYD